MKEFLKYIYCVVLSTICCHYYFAGNFTKFSFTQDEDDMEKESCPMLGEGGDSGGLIPGKSLVFATMELLMFILVRHMPHLSTKMSDSPSHTATKTRLSEESARLVAATVTILSDLPSLCSPAGTVLVTVWKCVIFW